MTVSPKFEISAAEVRFAYVKDTNSTNQTDAVLMGKMKGFRLTWGLDRNGLSAFVHT